MVFDFFEIVPGFFSRFFIFQKTLFFPIYSVFFIFLEVPMCIFIFILLKKNDQNKTYINFILYKQKSFLFIVIEIYYLSS